MAAPLKRFNLLPARRRRSARPHIRGVVAILACGVLVAVLSAASLQERNELRAHQRELAALTVELRQTEGRVRALQPYADRQQQVAAMTSSADEIMTRRLPWSDFLEQLSVAIPDSVWLAGLSCALPAETAPDATQSTPGDTPRAKVVLVGKSFSHTDVARFMTRLKQLPLLADVRLVDSRQTSLEATDVPQPLDFNVEASWGLAAPAASSAVEPVQ